MKISRNWLSKYIDLPYSNQDISDMLTTIGLEVEGFEEVSSIKGGLKGVVIGEVVSCEKHPDADKLSLTQVSIGDGQLYQIVCGAPNVAAGQKVLVATINATLHPSTGEPFTIKKAKIRGVESNGMICAADELGLGDDHSGIMILPSEVKPGTPAAEYFEVLDDVIFEIGLTPNRSDATCHLGVAKDLHAYIKVNKDPNAVIKEPNTIGFNVEANTQEIPVEVIRPDLCPRFTGLTIDGIKVGESPNWLQNQLRVLGIKSINSVVDITNYILHELGQPLHAYDAEKIQGKKIVVNTLAKGYKFLALDGKEIELTGEELMINDGEGNGLCMGGVYGGKNSGVTSSTSTIYLESAHFNSGCIRRSSMHHQLRTDAAKVFEKGSDPNVCLLALKRAAKMITELAGGKIVSEVTDIYPKPIKPKEIHLKYENVRNIIGTDISDQEINDILNAMAMEVSPVDDYSIKVFVPTNKADVVREIDVIEEVLRIYGFNRVKVPSKLNTTISYTPDPNKQKILNAIFDQLAAIGFNEMMGISMMDSKWCTDQDTFDPAQLVYVNNTSNVGLDVMRPSMLLSGLTSIGFNINRQQDSLRLFEFGKTYRMSGEETFENEMISIFITGYEGKQHWSNPKPAKLDFTSARAVVDMVLRRYYKEGLAYAELVDDKELQYGVGVISKDKNLIARVGEVKQNLLKMAGIKQKVFYAEIDVKALLTTHVGAKKYVTEISRFPAVSRDLAIVIDKEKTYLEIENTIKETKVKFLKTVSLFDIYENEDQLGKGKKSYALNFTFENLEKTLTDKEIEEGMGKIVKAVESRLEATIRK